MLYGLLQRRLHEYDIVRLDEERYGDVFELFYSNPMYLILEQGDPASMQICLDNPYRMLQKQEAKHRYFLLFYRNSRLEAVLNYIADYDEKRTVWIGRFLVDDRVNGTGVGRHIMQTFLEVCRNVGYRAIQLGVMEGSESVLSFWKHMGFEEMQRQRTDLRGEKEQPVIFMEKQTG